MLRRLVSSTFAALVFLWSCALPRLAAHADYLGGDPSASVPEASGATLAGALASAAVEPSSGALVSTLPIDVPAARGQAQPGLAVSYSSAAGIREAGVGWGLDLPSIDRSTMWGAPNYNDPNGDRFLFNGQWLVAICTIADGGGGKLSCPQASSEPFPDWVAPGMTYFRLENDTGARFFFSSDRFTWRVQLRGGEIIELGAPWVSRNTVGNWDDAIDFDDRLPGQRPFRWNLVRRFDPPAGGLPANVIVYRWRKPPGAIGRSYLSDVYYTAPVFPADTLPVDGFAHHIQIRWVNDLRYALARVGWAPTWRAVPQYQIASIDVASKPFSGGGSRELVRRYHFDYEAQNAMFYLAGFQQEGRCAIPVQEVGSELPEFTNCPRLPAMTMRYQPASTNLIWWEPLFQNAADTQFPADSKLVPVDINADGLPDLLDISHEISDGQPFYQSNGYSFFSPNRLDGACYSGLTGESPKGQMISGDFTGASSTQAARITHYDFWGGGGALGYYHYVGWIVYPCITDFLGGASWKNIWQGDPFPVRASEPDSFHIAMVGDVDGDGLTDFVDVPDAPGGPTDPTADPTGKATTYFSRRGGDTIGKAAVPTCLAPSRRSLNERFLHGSYLLTLADMNGDGLADLVGVGGRNQVVYWPSDGRGNFTACRGPGCPCDGPGAPTDANVMMARHLVTDNPTRDLHFADMNGDGFADLIQLVSDGVLIFLNNNGTELLPPIHVAKPTEKWDADSVTIGFADMNGNGLTELVVSVGSKAYSLDLQGPIPALVMRSDWAPRPGILIQIDNGIGAVTAIQYGTTASLERVAISLGKPWKEPVPQVMQVVTNIATHLKVGDSGSGYWSNRDVETSYMYDDPAWDGWERRFRGFRKVTEQRCADDGCTRTEQHFYIPDSPHNAAEANNTTYRAQRAASGMLVWRETFDANGHCLSTTSRSLRTLDVLQGSGGPVRFAYASQTDTYLYDQRNWTSFGGKSLITVVGHDGQHAAEVVLWTGEAPVCSPNNALLRVTEEIDAYHNIIKHVDLGHIHDDSSPIDEPIVLTRVPLPPRVDWKFLVDNETVSAFTHAGAAPPVPDDVPRQRQYKYDAFGRLSEVWGVLKGTLPLDRRHEDPTQAVAPPPPGASVDGPVRLAHYDYDRFDNVVKVTAPSGLCRGIVPDPDFAQLPIVEITYGGPVGGSGCGATELTSQVEWDRGLGARVHESDPSGGERTTVLDGFGRLSAIYRPDPTSGGLEAEPSLQMTYYIADGGPVQRVKEARHAGPGQWHERWVYLDGIGRRLLTLTQADPAAGDGGTWRVSGLPELDRRLRVVGTFEPWFYSGDPASHPLARPSTPETLRGLDHFGRLLSIKRPDGVVVITHAYGALEIDSTADDGIVSHQVVDGHGRLVEQRLDAGGDIILTYATYQVGGEPAALMRRHTARAPMTAPDTVTRWMAYDSFGRMVLNAEPNSASNFVPDPHTAGALHAWRYAWDDAGHLVGTSDARGCGENRYYDQLGRLVAEDYSPCLRAQALYTPFDVSTLTGAEVLNRYDTIEPGQTTDYGGRTLNLVTRLVSTVDRATHTRYAYDARGRRVGVARQLGVPPSDEPAASGSLPGVTVFVDPWFRVRRDYDAADRLVHMTTGAQTTELLGADGKGEIDTSYGAHGALTSITGSYGPIVAATDFDAMGRARAVVHGDVAATTIGWSYDPAGRLADYSISRVGPGPWITGDPLPGAVDPPALPALLESLHFTYRAGDVVQRIDDNRNAAEWLASAKPVTREYQYDPLRRVSRVDYRYPAGRDVVGPAPAGALPRSMATTRVLWQTFDYDWQGNTLVTRDDVGALFERSLGNIVNGTPTLGPNRLVSAWRGAVQADYDEAGQLTRLAVERTDCSDPAGKCSHRFAYDWDEIGQLVRARRWDFAGADPRPSGAALPTDPPAAELRYQFGASGERIIKSVLTPTGWRHTVDLFATLRLENASFNAATGYTDNATTEVALVPGLARVIHEPGLPRTGMSDRHVLLQLGDPLGSIGSVIDRDTGELVQRTIYQAYGGADSDERPARWGGVASPERFTGKVEDAAVGLVYFGARYYLPALGRWASPDPLTIHALGADPNPYAYVSGALSSARDPNGLDDGCQGSECGDPPGVEIGIGGGQGGGGTGGGGTGGGGGGGGGGTGGGGNRRGGSQGPPGPTPGKDNTPPPKVGFFESEIAEIQQHGQAIDERLNSMARYLARHSLPGEIYRYASDPEQTLKEDILEAPLTIAIAEIFGGNFTRVGGPIVPDRGLVDSTMVMGMVPLVVPEAGLDVGAVEAGELSRASSLMEKAVTLRNEVVDIAREVKGSRAPPAVVVGAYSPSTGRVVVGISRGNALGCAEGVCSEALGHPPDIQFTRAIRPRSGKFAPYCEWCELQFGRRAFPDPATEFESDRVAR
jgi:RHS repeat-associated protein